MTTEQRETLLSETLDHIAAIKSQCSGHADEFSQRVWSHATSAERQLSAIAGQPEAEGAGEAGIWNPSINLKDMGQLPANVKQVLLNDSIAAALFSIGKRAGWTREQLLGEIVFKLWEIKEAYAKMAAGLNTRIPRFIERELLRGETIPLPKPATESGVTIHFRDGGDLQPRKFDALEDDQ